MPFRCLQGVNRVGDDRDGGWMTYDLRIYFVEVLKAYSYTSVRLHELRKTW